jgi:hypothetical protein
VEIAPIGIVHRAAPDQATPAVNENHLLPAFDAGTVGDPM